MAQVKHSDRVRIHYTGKLKDGSVVASSVGRDPLEFTIGAHTVIPGLEEAVVGMSVGERKTKSIPSAKGFGPFHGERVQDLNRSVFPAGVELAVGQRFNASKPTRGAFVVTIVAISDDTVTIDGNHPLAGKDLLLEIELVEIL